MTGKNFFGIYLLCRYANEFPYIDLIWQDESLKITLRADGGVVFRQVGEQDIVVSSSGDVVQWNPCTDRGSFYIADAIKPVTGVHSQFVLLTSPQYVRFKELQKSPHVSTMGMPLWDEMEISQLWKLQYTTTFTESDWKGRFDKWGGIPRSVLEVTDHVYQEQLEESVKHIDIESCLNSIGMLRYDTDNASGTVLHMTVTAEGN